MAPQGLVLAYTLHVTDQPHYSRQTTNIYIQLGSVESNAKKKEKLDPLKINSRKSLIKYFDYRKFGLEFDFGIMVVNLVKHYSARKKELSKMCMEGKQTI